MDAHGYIDSIRLRLIRSPAISQVSVVQERASLNSGFFRARLVLSNNDFLEIVEYVVIEAGNVRTVEYRYQWMDSTRTVLRKRWDNAPHHPGLANFPHHVHVGDHDLPEAGRLLSVHQLIDMIEAEIKPN